MKSIVPILLPAAVTMLATSCGKQNAFVAPPPPEVDVMNPIVGEATVFLEFPGRTSASSDVEIRARVRGFLDTIEFDAGQYVEEGQLLFTIEPAEFEAAVRSAKGNVTKAKADLEIAETNYERRKKAFEGSGAVSEVDVLSADADRKAAEAAIEVAEAALADAERDLSYTQIHAPTSGRISSELVDPGNLVGANEATLLTRLVLTEPIYLNFEVSERDVLPFLEKLPGSDNPTPERDEMNRKNLSLLLSDGSVFGEKGKFDFIDNAVDPGTGTIQARAVFENKGGILADGLFARIQVPEIVPDAVQVPALSMQRDLGGSFVLVLDEENKVVRRSVVPTPFSLGAMRVLKSFDEETGTGLKADDRVIVSNLQRAREGIVVNPSEPGDMKEDKAPAPPEEGNGEPEKATEGGEASNTPEKPAE
ncbi:MAG: efflux RND transporter periplasmic adaptor subunit [Verrucomicrobiota bacterium]